MVQDGKILIGMGEKPAYLLGSMANRHGIIAGASGTGKTTTLKVLAESFSMLGVPVFLCDVKGDLAATCKCGEPTDSIRKRLGKMGFSEFSLTDFPVEFWDVYGEGGHPLRITISDMGPLLLSRLLGLTDAQEGILNIAFRVADDNGLLMIDLKDLKSMLKYVSDNRAELLGAYGNVTAQSVGAIQRKLLSLEDQGAHKLFGEPAIEIKDWMRTAQAGRGVINMLDCRKLFLNPDLYAAFLLWLMSSLFETMPEAGDCDKPKLVIFFDEAHLLFKDGNKELNDKIERAVKLIRSKGIGLYFVTQNPSDLPDAVLAQLSNRIQHALRAYTPSEQKYLRAAAGAFRANPSFDTQEVLTQLGTGEAVISCLDEKGIPSIAEKATIMPPQSRFGVLDEQERQRMIQSSPLYGIYESEVDRVSAYETLTEREAEIERLKEAERVAAQLEKERKEEEKLRQQAEKEMEKRRREEERRLAQEEREREKRLRPLRRAADSTLNTIGRELGRSIARGLFGTSRRR